RRTGVVIAVVEHDLEHPVRVLHLLVDLRLVEKARAAARVEERRSVAVVDPFEIAVGGSSRVVTWAAVTLVSLLEIDAFAVFRLVAIEHRVSLVVAGLTMQPAEGARSVQRICDPGVRMQTVNREDVV